MEKFFAGPLHGVKGPAARRYQHSAKVLIKLDMVQIHSCFAFFVAEFIHNVSQIFADVLLFCKIGIKCSASRCNIQVYIRRRWTAYELECLPHPTVVTILVMPRRIVANPES